MSSANAIGQVGLTLKSLLTGQIGKDSGISVTLRAPDESEPAPCVNLFLYKVVENTVLKNNDWQADLNTPSKMVPPPLSLNLYYMMTPYGQNDPDNGNISSHEILGRAMKAFFEFPVVPREYLHQDLVEARESIKIMLSSFDMEELSRIWNACSKPYRLSVLYEVATVQIDTGVSLPIPKRVHHVGSPQTHAPYSLPILKGMEPGWGPAGSEITIYGENIDVWSKKVTISGVAVEALIEKGDNSFTFKIPEDFQSGLYQIHVAIDRLCSSSFYFEVTE